MVKNVNKKLLNYLEGWKATNMTLPPGNPAGRAQDRLNGEPEDNAILQKRKSIFHKLPQFDRRSPNGVQAGIEQITPIK